MDTNIAIERVPFASLGDEWHALARAGYHTDYAGISELYGGATTADDKVALMQRWGGSILAWTARDAGRLIGVLTGDLDGDRLIVYDFFVAGAYRRQGIGQALVKTALSEPGLRQAAAEVNVANVASRMLFEALGFTAARTVSWYVLGLDGEVAP